MKRLLTFVCALAVLCGIALAGAQGGYFGPGGTIDYRITVPSNPNINSFTFHYRTGPNSWSKIENIPCRSRNKNGSVQSAKPFATPVGTFRVSSCVGEGGTRGSLSERFVVEPDRFLWFDVPHHSEGPDGPVGKGETGGTLPMTGEG